jgi:hypothetical protein
VVFLELRIAFVDPRTAGGSLSDYRRCAFYLPTLPSVR